MKKVLSLLVSSLLLVGVLAGCTSNKEVTTGGKTDKTAEAENYVLKFGMVAGNQSNEYKAAEVMADYVKEKSEGRLTIELFPNAQLGDDRAMLEQLRDGALDLTFAESSRFGIWVPRAELLGLSYMIDSFDHFNKVIYTTEFGKGLHEELLKDHNWRILSIGYNGTRQTTSNRPINSIEDMKGLKLRVPQHEPLLDYAEFTGASPTPMAFTEVYLALQTNAVDGQENPLSTIKAVKFHEVQKYLAMTNHSMNDVNYVASDIVWEKLPEDLQKILKDGAVEGAAKHTELFQNEEKELVSFFEGEGVTVTHPDLAPFKEAVSKSYQKYYDKVGDEAKDIIDQINSVR